MKPPRLLMICSGILFILVLVSGVQAAAPVANFNANPTSGMVPLKVAFTDTSTGSPTGWAWFFGDENFTQPWTLKSASPGWSGRGGHTSVVMPDGGIVLMGGFNGSYKNDTWRSTDKGATWTLLTVSSGWSARTGHSSVVMPDGSIVLMGGMIGYNSYKNDTWRSTDKGATWTRVKANSGWTARYDHSSVVIPDGSIILMGGGDEKTKYNDTWRSTDKGATWTRVNASSGWRARYGHSSVAMPDGSIVLMGGYVGGGFMNDAWRSTDKGATWTRVNASSGWTGRYDHSSVAMPDGSIVLMGGSMGGAWKNDTWRSTDTGATWTLINESSGWTGRSDHTSVVMPDGSIVLSGGDFYNQGMGYKNDVWRIQPVGSSLKSPSHTYTNSGNYSVALQVNNSGGYNSTRKVNYITVMASAPVANFTATPTSGTAPLTVQFTDTSTGLPTSWNWSFGDGNYSINQNPTYTYTSPGQYTVSLTATNAAGSDTKTVSPFINVSIPRETYKFVTKWGTEGIGEGQFNKSFGIAVDSSGNVYVADTYNHRIQKFSSTGTFLAKWGTSGTGEGQFSYPAGIAVNSSGNVYVADRNNNRIQKFSSNGTFLAKWGSNGTGEGQFQIPFGIAADPSGNVYVADAANFRIQKFSSNGTFLAKWGTNGSGEGQFAWPYGIAIDSSGNVFVSDFGNNRIQKFSSNGTLLAKWGTLGTGDGQFTYPVGIAVDSSGNFYVVDYGNNRIQKFSSNGTLLAKWGTLGTGDGQFTLPVGIAVDSSGNVYVADAWNNRIQKFAPYLGVLPARIGTFRNSTHLFYHDYNGNGAWNGASIDRQYNFGITGDIPVTGDWNNDRKYEIGVFRPSTHLFYLDYNGNGAWNGGLTDRSYNFGITGDIPVTGDWNNNGITEIGVFRPSTHVFYLDYNGNGVWNGAGIDRQYNFGITGDIPVAGDWNSDGKTEIGVFRNSTHLFYLDNNGNGVWNGAGTDRQYTFGISGDIPVAGDWNADIKTEIGIFRPSTHQFYLDYSGNGVWNGAGIDRQYNFGISNDTPISGKW